MTLHSAKGLEFPVVFIPGMEEGVFPGYRSIGNDEEIEEERRLCYVGITRAREKLYISCAKRRTLFGNTSYNRPSRFLEEIGYFNYLMDNDEDGDDRINNVRALLDDVKAFLKDNPESKFIDYLNNISLLSGQDDIKNTDSVSLMTVHTAKGLEFRIVFVVSLCQFIFPNNRAMMERKGGLEEERRLCYVAFTRAKDRLFVSYNRSYNYSTQSSNIASQFIEEAKLKPSETATKTNIYNNSILYSYKTNNSFNEPRHIVDQNKNVFCVNDNKPNNIKWNVGDTCIHDTFKF